MSHFSLITSKSTERTKYLLEFKDGDLEKAFRRRRLQSTLVAIRKAILIQFPSWLLGLGIIARTAPDLLVEFGTLALALNLPINLLFFTATRTRRYRELVPFYIWIPNVSANATITWVALHGMHDWMFALGSNIVIMFFGLLGLPLLVCQSLTLVAFNAFAIFGLLGFEFFFGAMPAQAFWIYGGLVLATIQLGTQLARTRNLHDRSHFVDELLLSEQKEKLAEEQARSERLLAALLPRAIADRLKIEQKTIADRYDSVSILFADLSGFTVWASGKDPKTIVEFLDQIFTRFDNLVAHSGLERIKTIGDAYMVASGLPEPRPDHARALVRLAIDMQAAIAKIRESSGVPLTLRIGIHTGPVVAGVIGATKFSYDLWGDAVNVASRMESHGKPNAIQISEDTYRLIQGEFQVSESRTIDVKGKGEMITRFVHGHLVAENSATVTAA